MSNILVSKYRKFVFPMGAHFLCSGVDCCNRADVWTTVSSLPRAVQCIRRTLAAREGMPVSSIEIPWPEDIGSVEPFDQIDPLSVMDA